MADEKRIRTLSDEGPGKTGSDPGKSSSPDDGGGTMFDPHQDASLYGDTVNDEERGRMRQASEGTIKPGTDEADGTDAGDGDAEDGGKEETRYDKLPRFQELNQKTKTLELELEKAKVREELLREEMKALREFRPAGQEGEAFGGMKRAEKEAAAAVLEISDEEFAEKMQENPKALMADLVAALKVSLVEELRTEQRLLTTEEQKKRAYLDFEQANPDFRTLWDDGTIKAYMAKHPGDYSPKGAYLAMKAEAALADKEKAVEDARKEGELRAAKARRAKEQARVGDGGPRGGGPGPVQDDELADTAKHGGKVAVLARRLMQRMTQGGPD